jgi:hypothetical protein
MQQKSLACQVRLTEISDVLLVFFWKAGNL